MTLSIEVVVRQCTEHVKAGLRPFVEHNMHQVYGHGWEARTSCQIMGGVPHWDLQALLKTIIEHWQIAFDISLPRSARNLVFELKDWRNHVAHDHKMTLEDTSRFVDTAARLLNIIGAVQTKEVEALRLQVLHAIIASSEAVRNTSPYALNTEERASLRPKLTPVSHTSGSQAHVAGAPSWQTCVDRLSVNMGVALVRRHGRCVFSADSSYSVCCLVSKEYNDQRFWWNLRERQLLALTDARSAYVAFACGSSDSIVLIPLQDFVKWLPTFNPKPGEDGEGWHIHIKYDGRYWWLLQTGRDNRVDITQYII